MHQLHDVPEAIKCYKKAAKADKKRPEPHEKLQDIFEKIGLDDLAEEEQEIAKRLRKAIYKAKSNPKRKKRWFFSSFYIGERFLISLIVYFT